MDSAKTKALGAHLNSRVGENIGLGRNKLGVADSRTDSEADRRGGSGQIIIVTKPSSPVGSRNGDLFVIGVFQGNFSVGDAAINSLNALRGKIDGIPVSKEEVCGIFSDGISSVDRADGGKSNDG